MGASNPFNEVSLKRREDLDTGNDIYYEVKYGFKIRWEDYIQLANVDSEFYDVSLPFDGFNNEWLRYDTLFGWQIQYTAKANVEENGFVNPISDTTALNVVDYESSTAYVPEIKVFDIDSGLELTSSILEDKIVRIEATFEKVLGSLPDLSSVSGVIEYEPYEQGGIGVIRGINDLYPHEDGSPFISVLGNKLLKKELTGSTFTFTAEIDGAMLTGAPKISARIYDPSCDPLDSTGQRLFKLFTLAPSITEPGGGGPLPLFCDTGFPDCQFSIPVYADGTTDDLVNDKSTYLVPSGSITNSTVIVLQKNELNVWTGKATLNNNDYGTLFAMGFSTNHPKYSGYEIDWKLVLAAFGTGDYRLKITENTDLGAIETFSHTYCLIQFNCNIDHMVRLEWTNNEGLGDINNDRRILDFTGVNWYNQVRIPQSIFGYPSSEYEKEDIQFSNGMIEDVKDVQTETYTLKLGSIPLWLHNIIKTYAMQSGTLKITDYSSNNPAGYTQKEVRITSEYAPRYKVGNKCSPVTVELQPTYNRYERFRCL